MRRIIGLLATIVGSVLVCTAVLSLAEARVDTTKSVLVLGAAALFLAYFLGPLLIGSVDQLDPRRFAVFGVNEKSLPWVLLLASVVSVPSLVLIAISACATIVAVHLGVAWYAAVLANLLGVVTILLATRVGMAFGALLLPERRPRELTSLFFLAILVIAFPVAVYIASQYGYDGVPGGVLTATHIVGALPIASPQGFVFAIAGGSTTLAVVGGIVTIVTLGIFVWLWQWLTIRLLTGAERAPAVRERAGLGWFQIMPANAFGAVAARSLVYWGRDRRYIVNVVIVPIAGALTVLPLIVAGVPLHIAILVPAPLIALFLGWLPHNDVAFDSTALWLHIASGLRGVPDRLGRLVPVTVITVPLLAIAASISLGVADAWFLLLPFSGLLVCLFLATLGMSSIASALAPYAVARPGDSPFQQPQRTASYGSYGAPVTFLASLALSAPTIWLFLRTVFEDSSFGALTFWIGLLTGIVVLVGGTLLGGWIFERSGSRLMEFVETT